MLRVAIPRLFTTDPLADIGQATRQAVARQIVLEHNHPLHPDRLRCRYERAGTDDRIDLIVEGTDQERMGFVLKRLAAHGYDGFAVEWAGAEPPPDLLMVFRSSDGAPATPSVARRVLGAVGSPEIPLVPDDVVDPPGADACYRAFFPPTFNKRRVAAIDGEDWIVEPLCRG